MNNQSSGTGETIARTVKDSWRRAVAYGVGLMAAVLAAGAAVYSIVGKNGAAALSSHDGHVLILASACVVLVSVLVYYQRRRVSLLAAAYRTSLSYSESESKRYGSRLTAVLDLTRTIINENELDRVFDCITEVCADCFKADRASLMMYEEEARELIVRSAAGGDVDPKMLGARKAIGQGVSGWAAVERKGLLLTGKKQPDTNPDLILNDETISASMVMPIVVRDELVGVINVSSTSLDKEYDTTDMQTLKLIADNAGACIRRAEQIAWMRNIVDDLLSDKTKVPTNPPS